MTELLHQQTEQSKAALLLAGFRDEFSNLKREIKDRKQETPCPFSDHKGYSEVWKKLTPDQQKYMQENIKVTPDNKIEIVKMKKKFSILTAVPNNVDVFDGSYKDKDGKTGMKGVCYLASEAAERECKKQNKKLLNNKAEVEQFINFFPGEGIKEKIPNFAQLFGLEKTGHWDRELSGWISVGSIGYVGLLRIDKDGNVYDVEWVAGGAGIYGRNRSLPTPFIAYEDIKTQEKKPQSTTEKIPDKEKNLGGSMNQNSEQEAYNKAKAEYDQARKEYNKQINAIKKRDKMAAALKKDEYETFDKYLEMRGEYEKLGTKELKDKLDLAIQNMDSKTNEYYNKGTKVKLLGIGGVNYPLAPDKITENDIKNKTIKYNSNIDQEQIKENYKMLNQAFDIYKSQGLALDYLRLRESRWNKNIDISSDYEPIFKKPTKPILKKPIKPIVQEEERKPTPTPKLEEEIKPEAISEKVLKPDTNKSGMFMMPDGKRYTYKELIKNFHELEDDKLFKKTFPGRERPKE